jgi:hypothetical protein
MFMIRAISRYVLPSARSRNVVKVILSSFPFPLFAGQIRDRSHFALFATAGGARRPRSPRCRCGMDRVWVPIG